MAEKNEKNIFTEIVPFYLILKASGMFPLSFDGKRQLGIFKSTWIDKVLSTVMLCVIIYLSSFYFQLEELRKHNIVVVGWKMR
jgi:hypothetical protein